MPPMERSSGCSGPEVVDVDVMGVVICDLQVVQCLCRVEICRYGYKFFWSERHAPYPPQDNIETIYNW